MNVAASIYLFFLVHTKTSHSFLAKVVSKLNALNMI
jgi:hypothetical protein